MVVCQKLHFSRASIKSFFRRLWMVCCFSETIFSWPLSRTTFAIAQSKRCSLRALNFISYTKSDMAFNGSLEGALLSSSSQPAIIVKTIKATTVKINFLLFDEPINGLLSTCHLKFRLATNPNKWALTCYTYLICPTVYSNFLPHGNKILVSRNPSEIAKY